MTRAPAWRQGEGSADLRPTEGGLACSPVTVHSDRTTDGTKSTMAGRVIVELAWKVVSWFFSNCYVETKPNSRRNRERRTGRATKKTDHQTSGRACPAGDAWAPIIGTAGRSRRDGKSEKTDEEQRGVKKREGEGLPSRREKSLS